MPSFGPQSESNLIGVHPDLVMVARSIILDYDCTILKDGGKRDIETARQQFKDGVTKLNPDDPAQPKSKHLGVKKVNGLWVYDPTGPSGALDITAYPVDWNDRPRFAFFAGLFVERAKALGVGVRSGVNWDADLGVINKTGDFFDGPHVELIL